jgi:hypothetical protein
LEEQSVGLREFQVGEVENVGILHGYALQVSACRKQLQPHASALPEHPESHRSLDLRVVIELLAVFSQLGLLLRVARDNPHVVAAQDLLELGRLAPFVEVVVERVGTVVGVDEHGAGLRALEQLLPERIYLAIPIPVERVDLGNEVAEREEVSLEELSFPRAMGIPEADGLG